MCGWKVGVYVWICTVSLHCSHRAWFRVFEMMYSNNNTINNSNIIWIKKTHCFKCGRSTAKFLNKILFQIKTGSAIEPFSKLRVDQWSLKTLDHFKRFKPKWCCSEQATNIVTSYVIDQWKNGAGSAIVNIDFMWRIYPLVLFQFVAVLQNLKLI